MHTRGQSLLVMLTATCACAWAAFSPQYTAYSPYSDYEDYYFLPKPVIRYPYYPLPFENYYRPYPYYKPLVEDDLARTEDRAAAPPFGRKTYYEEESNGIDDVNAAFLQNLIISQMARNAENRAPVARTHRQFDPEEDSYSDRSTKDLEDEEVKELKALARKPISHKSPEFGAASTNNYDYYDYPADDSFINWGSKRSSRDGAPTTERPTPAPATAPPPPPAAAGPLEGQREEVMMRPATPVRHPFPETVMNMLHHKWQHEKRSNSVYDQIKKMLAEEKLQQKSTDRSRLKKRFVASDPDLEAELHGLKRSISSMST